MTSLPAPRGSVGTVALNGRIHIIGGRDPKDNTLTTHEIFNPAKRVWTSLAPLPVARDHLAALAVKGKLHVIGGRTTNYSAVMAFHDVYVPSTKTWSAAPPMPTLRRPMGVSLYNGMLIVFGGECRGGKAFSENEAYHVANGT